MNIKIQGGGGGVYANTGSCTGVTSYLQHEDIDRMKDGKEPEPFFNHDRDKVSAKEVTFKIDNNKAKLCKSDAKFYVITVSPSREELAAMGKTQPEQAEKLKEYIRDDVMPKYAEGFGKGLKASDIEYYAKVHYCRGKGGVTDMHAHIIVSRKDRSNTKKLSPQTTHTGKKNCGSVKGGFDRSGFYQACEESFDKHFGYDRDVKESYQYRNTIKNGAIKDIQEQVERAIIQQEQRQQERERKQREQDNPINKLIEAGKEAKEREEERSRQPLQSGQQPEQARPQSAQLDEGHSRKRIDDEIENNRKRKKDRGFGLGM